MLVTGVSRKGGRKVNEDAYGEVRAGGVLCVAVADGLGGHNGGRIASGLAVDTILDVFKKEPDFSRDALIKYIMAANAAISEYAVNNPDYVHMSSTIVLLLVKGNRAIWANVGDSRLYRFKGGAIAEVTEDHSLAFLEFMNGDIEYDDIRASRGQNKLTCALGAAMADEGDVNCSEITRIDGSAAFLLCTDGWWEYVKEEQMEKTAAESKTTRAWIEAMLKIREENAPEGSDNYTAAAVML